jgi:hypothetical protein
MQSGRRKAESLIDEKGQKVLSYVMHSGFF